LIVHPDPEAILLEQDCTDRGIVIPRDLAIVAYDDEVAENGTPPIGVLRPAKEQIGRVAVEVLTSRLCGGDRPIQRTVVLPELNGRESSVVRHG
jgi:DNA-binding LacI/PurR family transcriptional regulator